MDNDNHKPLESAIGGLNKRLTAIELRLGIVSSPIINKTPHEPQTVQAPSGHSKEKSSASQSGSWLASVGMLFFVLAASFFIKLAIDSGWLTPERQLVGAFLFGLGLIGFGIHLKSKDSSYASFLPGAGVVIGLVDAY